MMRMAMVGGGLVRYGGGGGWLMLLLCDGTVVKEKVIEHKRERRGN